LLIKKIATVKKPGVLINPDLKNHDLLKTRVEKKTSDQALPEF
jgi:hypothetical protein